MKALLFFACTFLLMHDTHAQQKVLHLTKEQLSNLPCAKGVDDSMINGSGPYRNSINAEMLSTEKKKHRLDLTTLSIIRHGNTSPVVPDQLNPNRIVMDRDELNKLPASNLNDIIRLLDIDRFFTQW